MKKRTILLRTILSMLLVILLIGCGSSSTTSSDSTDDSSGAGTSFSLFETTEEAGPIVTPTSASGNIIAAKSDIWPSQTNLYAIYYLIREYVDSRDGGVVDGSNMYKAMYDATNYVNQAFENCLATTDDEGETIPSEHIIPDQSIPSPFDFGDDLFTQTYDCAYTTTSSSSMGDYVYSFASKHVDNMYYTLMGWHITTSESSSPQVYQTQYDSTANTIKVNSAYLVDYVDRSAYAVRIHIDGNTQTGLFALKLFKYNEGGLSLSIAGYGYSKNNNYYLFRVTSPSSGPEGINTAYYCFESDTTEEEMRAMEDAGSSAVPENCRGLEDNLPINYNTDASEVPTTTADFTGGGDTGIELTWTE